MLGGEILPALTPSSILREGTLVWPRGLPIDHQQIVGYSITVIGTCFPYTYCYQYQTWTYQHFQPCSFLFFEFF